jgi:hypothetical protein
MDIADWIQSVSLLLVAGSLIDTSAAENLRRLYVLNKLDIHEYNYLRTTRPSSARTFGLTGRMSWLLTSIKCPSSVRCGL